jgi:hypothetical protein
MFCLLLLLTLIALIATAPSAHAQRGIPDNPYPQTKKTPVPAPTSRTAQTAHYRDSLRLAYPVSAAGERCWRFYGGISIPGGDSYFCFRERGTVLDSVSRYGNMSSYYRGRWENLTVRGRVGPVMVEWTEPGRAPRSNAVITSFGNDSPPPR